MLNVLEAVYRIPIESFVGRNLVGRRDRWRNNIQVKFLWEPSVQWVRGFLHRDTIV